MHWQAKCAACARSGTMRMPPRSWAAPEHCQVGLRRERHSDIVVVIVIVSQRVLENDIARRLTTSLFTMPWFTRSRVLRLLEGVHAWPMAGASSLRSAAPRREHRPTLTPGPQSHARMDRVSPAPVISLACPGRHRPRHTSSSTSGRYTVSARPQHDSTDYYY